MELVSSDLQDGIRKIDLNGRLDVPGADAIDLRLTVLVSTEQTFAIIDLSGVELLASIGIATLVRAAKAARRRGGNVVLLNPRPPIASVLTLTKIDQVMPIAYSFEEACTLVKAASSAPSR